MSIEFIKRIAIVLVLFLSGCDNLSRLYKAESHPASPTPDIVEKEGVCNGEPTLISIPTDNRQIKVYVNGHELNQYEFKIYTNYIRLNHVVEISGGVIIIPQPWIPVCPVGSHYRVVSVVLST